MTSGSAHFRLLVTSALVLFLELACIRWFPAHVLYLTFFTNAVLLATFVGLSVGCLLAKRPKRLLTYTPYILTIALGAGLLAEAFQSRLESYVEVGSQANPEVVFYGAEAVARRTLEFRVPAEVLFGAFFVIIALVMVGPGQEMGRALAAVPNRVAAYSWNLMGSLAGIALFAVVSARQLPPPVWFAVITITVFILLRGERPRTTAFALTTALALSFWTSGWRPGTAIERSWSPYYRIDYEPDNSIVTTNRIGHQVIHPTERASAEPYALPYLFQRDVTKPDGTQAWPAFKRVLVIGAGTGNDVARACQWLGPEATIDAVDIDPVIQRIGTLNHPDRPFDDIRVRTITADGRNFLRSAVDGSYDLVVFALIDSLVLQSGYSNLRLESYLYTLESFRDVRRVLSPHGVFCISNFFRRGWITARLRNELREVFETEPALITIPPTERITADYEDRGFAMFFAARHDAIAPLSESFTRTGHAFWYPWGVPINRSTASRFSPIDRKPTDVLTSSVDSKLMMESGGAVVAPKWIRLQLANVDEVPGLEPATDDWPFLYTREPMIPMLTLRGIGVMIILSAIVYWLASRAAGPSPTGLVSPDQTGLLARSFFLGAGFMLIETKAVVHMALLFGSTWTVNTVVFTAVLLMSLAGNLLAGFLKPQKLIPYYLLLFIALTVNIAIPPDTFLGVAPALQIALSCLIAFAPVGVAGIIFAASFARSTSPDRMIGANVAGALLGGLAENASMLLGFRLLGLIAVGFYLISALGGGYRGVDKRSNKSTLSP